MTHPNCIRVLIVDDHDMVRKGLSVLLQAFDDLELVGEARDGLEAISMSDKLDPDVILMDLIMPQMNGIEATRVITHKHPNTRVIALTSFEEENMVMDVLEAGAISYLQKNVTIDVLGDSIRKANLGLPTLSPEATHLLINTLGGKGLPNLSAREMEILKLMAAGLNNLEIALKLGISRSTIKTHASHILAKLGVSSRLKAVRIAIEHHLLS
ncbi:MAG: response regulator transcription factor [Chloroflexi bacterium]|nr:response regulator transcription factor [Chloroflexota bacterium]